MPDGWPGGKLVEAADFVRPEGAPMNRRILRMLFVLGIGLSVRAYADQRKPPPPASELPPAKLALWLDGLHLRDGRANEQADVHHFCATPATGPIQCTLWSGFGPDAKLVGVEYIIDEKTFGTLPENERRLWHSHVYEATSGMLVAPGMSEQEETVFLKKAVHTYGKTWHTWNEKLGADVPLGRPELMMAFTRDGMVKPDLLASRDEQLGVNTQQLRASRAKTLTDLPAVMKGADQGEGGRSCRANEELRARKPPIR